MFTPNKSQGILREDVAHDERVDGQPMRHHHNIVSYDFMSVNINIAQLVLAESALWYCIKNVSLKNLLRGTN